MRIQRCKDGQLTDMLSGEVAFIQLAYACSVLQSVVMLQPVMTSEAFAAGGVKAAGRKGQPLPEGG